MSDRSNFNGQFRTWVDNEKGYKKRDYVPLSERSDWDVAVEKLPAADWPVPKPGERS